MSFLRPSKKEPDEISIPGAAAPAPASSGDTGALEQLTERLAGLGQSLDDARQHLIAHLVRRESQTVGGGSEAALAAVAEKIDAVCKRLDQLGAGMGSSAARPALTPEPTRPGGDENLRAALLPISQRLDQFDIWLRSFGEQLDQRLRELAGQLDTRVQAGGPRPDDPLMPAISELQQGIHQNSAALSAAMGQLFQYLDAGFRGLHDLLRPEEPEEVDASPASSADWQQALLGHTLTGNRSLESQRRRLLDGVLQGDPAASALVGQLLVFRSVPPEKMPPLLKEIGEAYYRWEPKTEHAAKPMEQAVVAWLQRCCDESGISNTIELVHPGERFDSSRHNATTRGVEITEVLGWIVLRDNGKVYTKASVAVR